MHIQGVSGENDNIKGVVHQILYRCVIMVAYLSGDSLLLYGKFHFSFYTGNKFATKLSKILIVIFEGLLVLLICRRKSGE